MFFGENLQILRKRDNLSQEDLADKLQVSRQAVSKWESGTGFPETEKIIAICEVFKCSMDELVKGKISLDVKSEKEEYERIMNKQIYGSMLGVAIILLGVTIMMILMGLAPVGELEERYSMFGIISILIAVAVAVPTFIITGNEAENFKKNNTKITNMYTDKELENIKRKTTIIKAIGIFIILVGTIIMFSTMTLNIFGERTQLSVACLLGCITIAIPFLIYAGQNEEKVDIEKYNLGQTKEAKKNQQLIGKICGTIMLVSTIIFLIWSFTTNMWNISWIVFPIGGILCGIVGTIFGSKE